MSEEVEEIQDDQTQEEDNAIIEKDQQYSDIVYGLSSTYNSLQDIDDKLLSKAKAAKLRAWKNKLWRSMGYYVDQLSEGEKDNEDDD